MPATKSGWRGSAVLGNWGNQFDWIVRNSTNVRVPMEAPDYERKQQPALFFCASSRCPTAVIVQKPTDPFAADNIANNRVGIRRLYFDGQIADSLMRPFFVIVGKEFGNENSKTK